MTVQETRTQNVRLKKVSDNYFRTIDDEDLRPCTEPHRQDVPEIHLGRFECSVSFACDTSRLGLCGLCLTAEANAVLMSCGHGGLCKGCAITMMQTSRPCYLCRGEIVYVYEVNSKAIVKAKVQIGRKPSV